MVVKDWNIEAITGYHPISTFYTDFSIADNFFTYERKSVEDTYNRSFESFKGDYKMMTELCMVLNWKSWEHTGRREVLCNTYIKLFEKCRRWCLKNLKGEELSYFLQTTD